MESVKGLLVAACVGVTGVLIGMLAGVLGNRLMPEYHAPKSAAPALVPAPPLLRRAVVVGDAGEGKMLFVANCAPCHGPDGAGHPGLAPSIRNRDFLAIASDKFIRKTIMTGRPGTAMVPRPNLAGQKIAHIISYLRSLTVVHPVQIAVDPYRRRRGDAVAGAGKYAVYCASCHGAEGQGYSAGGAGPGIGLVGFLSAASDDYIFQTVAHGRSGTPMRSFLGAQGLANLSEADVHDIISHLRANVISVAALHSASTFSGPGDPQKGQRLFRANCAACHQADGAGKAGLAPSIRNRDFLALADDAFIQATVRHGRPGTAMVPRPDLAGEKLQHIIAFLRSIDVQTPVQVTVDPELRLSGDAVAGRAKFARYCAACHGKNGEGYSAGGSGLGIGLPGFLSVACDDYILQTVKRGRIGTAMKPFVGAAGLANLDESDVADMIAHLRSLNAATH